MPNSLSRELGIFCIFEVRIINRASCLFPCAFRLKFDILKSGTSYEIPLCALVVYIIFLFLMMNQYAKKPKMATAPIAIPMIAPAGMPSFSSALM